MASVQHIIRPYKNLATYVGIILSCAVAIIFGLFPVYRTTRDLYFQSTDLSQKVTKLKEKLRMLQGLDEDIVRDQLLSLIAAIPQEKSIPTLFTTVEGVSAQAGVTVSEISFAAGGPLATEAAKRQTIEEKKLGVTILPFTLSMEGELNTIRSFLDIASNVRRIFRIREFTLTIPETGVPKSQVEIDGFFSPFPASIADVSETLAPLTQKEEETVAKVNAIPLTSSAQLESIPISALPPKADPFSP